MPARTTPHTVLLSPAGLPPCELGYERRGSGEPLLLLHGLGHHWQAWEPVLTLLAASYDVIAPDLPGFGTSPPLPDGTPDPGEATLRVLTALCTALDAERPHLAGNSLGGLLALRLAARGAARSVTALSPAGFWTEPERIYAAGVLRTLRAGARAMPDGAVRFLARRAAGRALLTSAIYARPGRRSPDAVLAETRALRDAPAFGPTLAAGRGPGALFRGDLPDIPVTVAWGERDRVLVPRQGVRAKRVVPGARLVRLRGCGHVPMNDAPATVSRVILDTARTAV
ncbi:alpha/beta fold hydrolase [Streptomyces boncukensis]|nr:alpha/beta hydrolase [Streptomyces boncukensis]